VLPTALILALRWLLVWSSRTHEYQQT